MNIKRTVYTIDSKHYFYFILNNFYLKDYYIYNNIYTTHTTNMYNVTAITELLPKFTHAYDFNL